MKTTAAVAAAFLASLVAGCTSPGASVSVTPTLEPTPIASPSASATPTPSPTPTSDPVITAGPLTVAGEFSFGSSDFGGVPYGLPYDTYVGALGPTVHQSACGDENLPSIAPGSAVANWELFLIVNWDDPAVAWLDWDTKAFLLVDPQVALPIAPTGPVGPRGLRLGTPEATVEAMFPAEAAVTTTRTGTYLNPDPIIITERVFTIADLDGGPMIITTADGVVATMMWGDPAYVDPGRGFLRCPS
jgi:hypothetical protein